MWLELDACDLWVLGHGTLQQAAAALSHLTALQHLSCKGVTTWQAEADGRAEGWVAWARAVAALPRLASYVCLYVA